MHDFERALFFENTLTITCVTPGSLLSSPMSSSSLRKRPREVYEEGRDAEAMKAIQKDRKLRQNLYAEIERTKDNAARIADPTTNAAAKHLRRGRKLDQQAERPRESAISSDHLAFLAKHTCRQTTKIGRQTIFKADLIISRLREMLPASTPVVLVSSKRNGGWPKTAQSMWKLDGS